MGFKVLYCSEKESDVYIIGKAFNGQYQNNDFNITSTIPSDFPVENRISVSFQFNKEHNIKVFQFLNWIDLCKISPNNSLSNSCAIVKK